MVMATKKLNMKTVHIYEMCWSQAAVLDKSNSTMARIDGARRLEQHYYQEMFC